ncbi:hypothetical protein ACFX13_029273 [Malus domestica]
MALKGLKGMGNALNNNISRTFSYPPTVAAEKTSSDTVLSQKLSLPAGKESFKKRKADKVQINKPILDGRFLLKRARSIE